MQVPQKRNEIFSLFTSPSSDMFFKFWGKDHFKNYIVKNPTPNRHGTLYGRIMPAPVHVLISPANGMVLAKHGFIVSEEISRYYAYTNPCWFYNPFSWQKVCKLGIEPMIGWFLCAMELFFVHQYREEYPKGWLEHSDQNSYL